MFKKIAGLFLAATMIFSAGVITSSAAEADESAVAADDQSAVIAADDTSSGVGATNEIYFDVNSSGWGNVKNIFCHIWRADGTGSWPAWQGKAEKCKYDADKGIATYDLSKTGNDISKSDGRIYCVIFSANTGMQTYNTIMSGACIGDTVYCTGNIIENPEDSEKTCIEAAWRKNTDCGAEKKITSTSNIVGSALPEGETNTTMLATYLIQYYSDDAKLSATQNLVNQLKVSPLTVMAAVTDKLTATANPDAEAITASVKKVLLDCTDPTAGGEKVDEKDMNDAADKGSAALPEDKKDKDKVSAGSSSGSSNKGTSGGSGTGSVKSGQETTIFFVFGGMMIAAAGVMFLARKKREE